MILGTLSAATSDTPVCADDDAPTHTHTHTHTRTHTHTHTHRHTTHTLLRHPTAVLVPRLYAPTVPLGRATDTSSNTYEQSGWQSVAPSRRPSCTLPLLCVVSVDMGAPRDRRVPIQQTHTKQLACLQILGPSTRVALACTTADHITLTSSSLKQFNSMLQKTIVICTKRELWSTTSQMACFTAQ